MARRDLLQEAQVTAAAEVAPQVAALQEALQQARVDRNSAIHAAATAYKGLSGAIHRAGPNVRRAYGEAKAATAGTDAITAPALKGNATIAAAAAHEGKVGGRVLASSLASRLADLSDKRIAAAAGRAFSVTKANSDYSAAAATNASKRSSLAAQQGLLVGSTLSKLNEAQAQRDFTSHENAVQRQFQASQTASDHAFTHHEDALGRRSDRINTGISTQAELDKLGAQQKFTAGENKKNRQNAVKIAGISHGTAGAGPKPTADHVFKGRTAIALIRQEYDSSGKKMHEVHADAKKKGYPDALINAAADLHSKGHIAPQGVAALEALGYNVPKEWQGVQVRAHTRSRRGK